MSRVGGWLQPIMGRSPMVSPPTWGSGFSNLARQYRQFDTSTHHLLYRILGKSAKSHFLSSNILEKNRDRITLLWGKTKSAVLLPKIHPHQNQPALVIILNVGLGLTSPNPTCTGLATDENADYFHDDWSTWQNTWNAQMSQIREGIKKKYLFFWKGGGREKEKLHLDPDWPPLSHLRHLFRPLIPNLPLQNGRKDDPG